MTLAFFGAGGGVAGAVMLMMAAGIVAMAFCAALFFGYVKPYGVPLSKARKIGMSVSLAIGTAAALALYGMWARMQ